MRNASIEDVMKAQETGVLEENVMYTTLFGIKLHGKRASLLEEYMSLEKGQTVAETDVGDLLLLHVSSLRYNKPQNTTSRKPKTRPKKGTKPERKIVIDEGTELKVGDVVEDADGDRGVITATGKSGCEVSFAKPKHTYWIDYYYLKYLILLYQEPVKHGLTTLEETYKYQDWICFEDGGSKVVGLLCQTRYNEVMLTVSGNRWLAPVIVKDSDRITKQELIKILGEDATNFRKVSVEIVVKD